MAKTRPKKPFPLRGLPAAVIALSPANWPPGRRARWVRGFLAGRAGLPRPELRREDYWDMNGRTWISFSKSARRAINGGYAAGSARRRDLARRTPAGQ